MITDGRRSFVIFLYADGEIQWTTGDASGGRNGFGGTEAQVGFNAGDGIRFASVPGSRTGDIVNIDTTSNVGIPGVWVFRVDEDDITVIRNCSDDPAGIYRDKLNVRLNQYIIAIAQHIHNSFKELYLDKDDITVMRECSDDPAGIKKAS